MAMITFVPQLKATEILTPKPRTRKGKISAGINQQAGPVLNA